jgi:undecaprenyl phosphate-alpha-L-ara4N flippase subunit ArnF
VTTPFSSMAFVFAAGFVGSFGAAFLKSGAGRLRGTFESVYTNWRLAAGILSYGVSSVFFVRGIAQGELSVLYPMVALGYMWTILWSKMFFGEPLTWGKLGGLVLIFAGLTMLGLGRSQS